VKKTLKQYNLYPLANKEKQKLDMMRFTCYDCLSNKECEWAYDEYNLNGDCLAEK
jgi:MoaA/NifB/PqqE/SkfB family radical SAM enzyme